MPVKKDLDTKKKKINQRCKVYKGGKEEKDLIIKTFVIFVSFTPADYVQFV